MDDTRHWLRDVLGTGPVPTTELFERAKALGYFADQVRWALDCLNASEVEVTVTRVGGCPRRRQNKK